MGKKKIAIEFIEDPRKRKLCFDKRQQGLIKKAMELVKLASVDVGLIIMSQETDSLVEFWSDDKTEFVKRYQKMAESPHYDFTINDYEREISNTLSLRPFGEHARIAEAHFNVNAYRQPYGASQFLASNQLDQQMRPLKRPRVTVEADDLSSCGSRGTTPPPFDTHLEALKSLENDLSKLVAAGVSAFQPPTTTVSNTVVPTTTSPCVTQQPASPVSTVSEASSLTNLSTAPSDLSVATTVVDGVTGISEKAQEVVGEIDVSGLLDYIGKLEGSTSPVANTQQVPVLKDPSLGWEGMVF